MAAGEWGQWGWTNLPCWNITLNVGANHSLDTLCPLCTIKQGPYFCRSVRIPLFKNYNSPPCMVKSSFSLIQGPFLLPLLLPRMLGAPARGKGPAQATSAQTTLYQYSRSQLEINFVNAVQCAVHWNIPHGSPRSPAPILVLKWLFFNWFGFLSDCHAHEYLVLRLVPTGNCLSVPIMICINHWLLILWVQYSQ